MAEEEVQYSYEYWDCQCATKALRGDVMVCPGCGHPRDADTKFYRKEGNVEVITDDKHLERFKAGPDWICSFCQELNSDLQKQCRGCGHLRYQSDQNYIEHQQDSVKPGPSAPAKENAKNSRAMIILGAFLTIVFGGGFWYLSG